MKYKVVAIACVLLYVLGVTLIIFQLVAGEKSVLRSIAAGAMPISMGAILFGVSRMLKRKHAAAKSN